MENKSSLKRESKLGRWIPIGFYTINIISFLIIDLAGGDWSLLFLVLLPLPAMILYLIRTKRKIQ